MWIVCITSVRHVLTVNGYGGRQTKENEKSWCFKGWETLVNDSTCLSIHDKVLQTSACRVVAVEGFRSVAILQVSALLKLVVANL